MTYPGILTSRPGEAGVRVDFDVDEGRVVVTCDSDTFEWQQGEVRIAPWDTTTVRLDLPDGELFYRADDPLRFTEAVEQATAPASSRRSTRWWDSVFSSPTVATPPPDAASDQVPEADTSDAEETSSPNITTAEPTLTERAAAIDLADPWADRAAGPQVSQPSKWRRRFRRSREHTHRWTATTVSGGIVRRVCQDCHYVSIDLRRPDQVTTG